MKRFYPQKLMGCRHCSCRFLLIACWCAGVAGGVLGASNTGSFLSLMRMCCESRVSIVNLLIIPCFPFLISAIAVYFDLYPILLLCAVFKLFCFSFCACITLLSFHSAGYLICILLLYTDILTTPVLCRFQWLGYLRGRVHFYRNTLLCLLWFVGVCVSDYIWIAPLLREIL